MELIGILASEIDNKLFETYLMEGKIDDFKDKIVSYFKQNVMDKESAKKVLRNLVDKIIKFGKNKRILMAHLLTAIAIYLSPIEIRIVLEDTMKTNKELQQMIDSLLTGSFSKFNSISANLDSYEMFKYKLAQTESGNNPYIANNFGYIGKYQFGNAALIEGGVAKDKNEANKFREGFIKLYKEYKDADSVNKPKILKKLEKYFPESQHDAAFDKYVKKQERYLINGLRNRGMDIKSLDMLVGKTINGIPITKSGLIAALHLAGYKGVAEFIISNGEKIDKDGNGVPLTTYLEKFANYEIKD